MERNSRGLTHQSIAYAPYLLAPEVERRVFGCHCLSVGCQYQIGCFYVVDVSCGGGGENEAD